MNSFDIEIINYINQFSQHSQLFDESIIFLSNNNLLKGAVLSTLIWWAWFESEKRPSQIREHLISTLFCCAVAMALARFLAITLPFRLRPIHEESLYFLLPYGTHPTLEGWSSFPSDHAVLFFALSTGLFFASKRVGAFALSYTVLFIVFPRVYLGLHYPTDIIAGAIIGISITILGNMYLIKKSPILSIANLSYSKPNIFYPLFFLLTYQIANLFDDSRELFSFIVEIIKNFAA